MGATEADPFAIFHTPPPNETAGERAAREATEAEQKRVSDQIDEQLKAEKLALKKQKYIVRVLLLGQSESGKSTTLKNFRMKYARDAWEAERLSWRSVIQLNVIRSIITIVETLQAEMDGEPLELAVPGSPLVTGHVPLTPSLESPGPSTFDYDPLSKEGASPAIASFTYRDRAGSISADAPGLSRTNSLSRQKAPLSTLLTGKHQLLKLRLGPLRRVEKDLQRLLGASAVEEQDGAAHAYGPLSLELESQALVGRRSTQEFGVVRLQEALERGVAKRASMLAMSQHGHGTSREGTPPPGSPDVGVDDATEVIASCLEDMKTLWTDEVVRVILRKRKLRLEDSAGFFLDDLDRIAKRDYEPSDDDVVRARLRTMGVQEYRIEFENKDTTLFSGGIGGDAGKEWILYDVGGSRTVRHAWIPYFDNVQAIIFLAPVSCFDERLAEDSRVNRLEDSFLLWRHVCGSKLLASSTMILFLNKCDILKKKLKAGIMVKKYMPSYGDRPNDVGHVVKYLKQKFIESLKENSPAQRSSYFYPTSVVDTKATSATISAVKDSIIRDYLKTADFV
ncbi:G-protein alpha subunit [Gymnopilus junonius]|uniref:G-protein alpha subunit n=1 Tax=Gymnopilus junonius TaxID=109634 RepID=A0A9P5NIU0_GYMJU|nr:G-protein alpha subunit [Gymnopilus junonius]